MDKILEKAEKRIKAAKMAHDLIVQFSDDDVGVLVEAFRLARTILREADDPGMATASR